MKPMRELSADFPLGVVKSAKLVLLIVLTAWGHSVSAFAALTVVHDYPFTIEIPSSWKPVPNDELSQLKASVPDSMHSLYKQYSGYTGEPFSTVPHIIGYYSPDRQTKLVGSVIRFPPEQDQSALFADDKSKIEFGIKQGIIKKVHSIVTNTLGEYTCLMLDAESNDGGRMFSASLFNPSLPYQAVSLMCLYSGSDPNQAMTDFRAMLESLKLDFAFSGKVGNERFILSSEVQEFWIVTDISNMRAERCVLLVQEPHWDYWRQWNLCLGLRQFFKDNPKLLAKTVFLAEGANALDPVSVTPLRSVEPAPTEFYERAALASFLIPGYVAFAWETGDTVPILGTEDWPLYLESARLWKDREDAAWAVTVSARNVSMVEVLMKMAEKYDNPMLFFGGMHLHKIRNELYFQGHSQLNMASPSAGKGNRGIKDLLLQRGIDYVYVEALPDKSLTESRSEQERYRKLMAIQLDGNYADYLRKTVEVIDEADIEGLSESGVTVTPKPAEAAKLIAALKKGSSGGGDSDKSKGKGNIKKGGGIGGAIDRFKDALSKLNLRGKNLKSGRSAIRDADPNLTETRDDTGLHQWSDKNRVRVEYRRRGAHNDAHWAKWAADGTRIDNAGRPGVEHIPAK